MSPLAFSDEEAYAQIADEMNDYNPPDSPFQNLKIDDFERRYVLAGERYAKAHGLSWPPEVGDFDRYWERKHNP